MPTHARYAEIKKWADATGRRSIQLWMARDTVSLLDRLCRERGVRRAEVLDSLISAASVEYLTDSETRRARRPQS